MLTKIYSWFHHKFSKLEQRGAYSAGFWQERVRKKVLSLCQDREGRFLEVGCGEGLFLIPLAKQHPNQGIWGIDHHSQRLNQARERINADNLRNINLSAQNARQLFFDDGYFDTVVCINVLFNLDSLHLVRQVLGEIKRVTKKEGKIIFDFRNSLNPLLQAKYRLAHFYDRTVKNLPLNTYSLKEMQGLIKDLSLDIVNKKFIGFPLKRFAPLIIIEAQKL